VTSLPPLTRARKSVGVILVTVEVDTHTIPVEEPLLCSEEMKPAL
jgi:hypothetical protein